MRYRPRMNATFPPRPPLPTLALLAFALPLGCAIENGVKGEPPEVEGFDSGVELPPPDTDSGGDTYTAPTPSAPLAVIDAPEAGATIEGCTGTTLVGRVSDDDTPADQLIATWTGDGAILWSGPPEADGTTSVDWDPGDGDHVVVLDVVDTTSLSGTDNRAFTLAPPSATPTFTWSRSAMDDRVGTEEVGTCIAAALALPTSTSWVWDNGDYSPPDATAEALAAGRSWASWDQVYSIDCHLFELEVEVPECGDYGALQVASPWFDGIPINDNIYVVVDGAVVLQAGTDYGAGRGGPVEVDYWLAEHVEIPLISLSPGTNIVDFVVEERVVSGGLGYLEPQLVE